MKRNMRYILIYITVIALGAVLLSGCTTQKKVNNYLLSNPDYASKICNQLYPVQATEGKADVDVDVDYKPADNIDYTEVIDSLSGELFSLSEELEASKLELDYVKSHAPDTCAGVVNAYENRISKLNQQITSLGLRVKSLQLAYKPCEPDLKTVTVTKTITNTVVSTAEKEIITQLASKLAVEEGKAKTRLWWAIIVTVIAALLIIVLVKK